MNDFHERDHCWFMLEREELKRRLVAIEKSVSRVSTRVEVLSVKVAVWAAVGSIVGAGLVTAIARHWGALG